MTSDRLASDEALRPLNARSLALSALLGTHPPELPGRGLVALAELFGIAGGTMRTALSRMVAAGELAPSAGRYRLVGALLDRQRAQDAGRLAPAGGWSGAWHTIVTADDQRPLAERRRFRTVMADQRFGELRPDIWMRPANVPAPAPEAGWIVTTGPVNASGPDTLVRRLWDLDALAASAAALRAALDELRRTLDWSDPASIPPIFTTSAAVVHHLRADPMLPAPLLPDDWPVGALRTAYDGVERDLQRLLRRFLRNE